MRLDFSDFGEYDVGKSLRTKKNKLIQGEGIAMKKGILAVFFLTAALSVNVAAQQPVSSDDAGGFLPECTKCEECGEETLQQQSVRYEKWRYAGYVECVHEGGGSPYQDERQIRTVLYPTVCKNCGLSDTKYKVEERFLHIGNRKAIQYIL